MTQGINLCHRFDGFKHHELIKFQVFATRYEVLQRQQHYCCERIMDYVVSAFVRSFTICLLVFGNIFFPYFCDEICEKNAIEMEMNSVQQRKKNFTRTHTHTIHSEMYNYIIIFL